MAATHMHQQPQWHPQQYPQMHMNTYQDQEPLGHWSMQQTTLAPYQSLPQHPTHIPMMSHPHMAPMQQHPQTLRPQSSQTSLSSSALPSPVHHGHPHSQSMASHLTQPLSLPSLGQNPLPMSHPSPQQQPQRYNQPVPHQVVGQQGIRGVLPKSTGDRSSPDETCEPEMTEDGTWPCKFCGKKYRHAKHLRRHHARHTGETPYECQLCARRFGRSDVLKRHYHKCATRRGVEVGDHLQGQRGHPRRRARGPGGDLGQDLGSPLSNGPPEVKSAVTPGDGMNGSWAGQ